MSPTAFVTLRRRHRDARDALREQRLDSIIEVVDRFVYDVARLMAGHTVVLEGVTSIGVARQVRASLGPLRESGNVVQPDFGHYGELRVDGDLLDLGAPVAATLDFDDRSVRETQNGTRVPLQRRRVRMRMRIAMGPLKVEHLAVSLSPLVVT